jgi:hypothetical protein
MNHSTAECCKGINLHLIYYAVFTISPPSDTTLNYKKHLFVSPLLVYFLQRVNLFNNNGSEKMNLQ